jgi:aspartate 1-decarboxylase
MAKSQISEYEKVLVVNINNGNRFETYVIPGKHGTGEICINGAAAHLAAKGDLVIIMSFVLLHQDEVKNHKPISIPVSENNKPL